MKNTFKFSYLTPTPDTLANIALCRWNDALKGLPAFIQIYMQSQHFLQGFGFSRALSYKEYLNKKINRNTDLKVYVGGYEINLSELLVDNDLDLVKLIDGHYNLATFFRITFDTEEVLLDSNFISHDGSSIPVTEQNITITVELCYSDDTNWNSETQRPLSNLKGNSASALFDMDIDDNSDGLYGRDCTLWTTPTEKTIYGYRWQCAIPISFLMPDNESVSNIYFDRNSGEFESLYAVPVVKRFFQNIEKAIYDTHLLNCLHDYGKTEEEIDEEHNEYVVVGGVNLDEDTENLYPIGDDNDHIEYIISEMQSDITDINTDITNINIYITNINTDITNINSRMVTTHSIDSETVGDNQNILGEKSFNNSSTFWAKTNFNDDINVNLYRGQGYTPNKVGIINTGDDGGIAIRGCCNIGDHVFELWRDDDDQLLMRIKYEQNSGSIDENFKTYFYTSLEVYGISKFTNATITTLTVDRLLGKNNDTIELDNVFMDDCNISGSFTVTASVDFIGGVVVSDSLEPGDDTITLGSNGNKFAALYAKQLYGVIPTPNKTQSSFDVPIGAIVLAINVWTATEPGATVAVTSGTTAYVCDINGTASQYLTKLSTGIYKTLSCAANNAPVLLMRIE